MGTTEIGLKRWLGGAATKDTNWQNNRISQEHDFTTLVHYGL